MYNPQLVKPMREELTSAGFKELLTAEDVDAALGKSRDIVFLVINSVCGCAAGAARPAARLSLENEKRPAHLLTVFAGQDKEATERARSYLQGLPPSSPSMALFKDGEVVHFIPRHDVEGHSAEEIAQNIKAAFNRFC